MLSSLRTTVSDVISPAAAPLTNNILRVGEWVKEHPHLALSSAAAALAATYMVSSYRIRKQNLPPGPTPLPIIGSRHLLDFNKIHESFDKLGKKHGDFYMVYIFSRYSAIKEGFQTERYLMAGRPTVGFAEDHLAAVQEEIFMADYSEKWKVAKKCGINGLKKFAGPQSGIEDIMMKEVEFLIDSFRKCGACPVSLKPVFLKVTGNVSCSFLFDKHYDDHDDPELQNLVAGINNYFREFVNKPYPWGEMDHSWLAYKKFGDLEALALSHSKGIRDHILKMMNQVKDKMDPENPQNFMEYFLATRNLDDMGGIRGFADTLVLYILDPVESVSGLLEWTMFYLAYFPEVQSQLQQVTDKVVGQGHRVGMEHRQDLGLIESFLHEVQRHCCFMCLSFPHTCSKDNGTFRGYSLPKDAVIYANFYAAHMDPKVHPQPEKFQMDRFIDEADKFRKADSVMQFGMGARSCPGEMHSRMEMFLFISNLVHHFNISFPAGLPRPQLGMQHHSMFKIPQDFTVVFTER